MSQFLRRFISLPIQSIRSFHSFDEITPAKYISTRLQNGIGSRYVCQLQRLTIQVCKEFRTSYGTREWIANDLTAFARQHPYVVVYVQPRRHRPPNLIGEYLSGDRQWIPLSNCDRQHVNWWIQSLLTQQGDPQWRLLKQMHTDSPSIQGIWTPFTNKSIDRATRTYPDKDLNEMEYPQMTATQQIQELFEQQKTNKTT
jgi:large subunit ribosomal protein L43